MQVPSSPGDDNRPADRNNVPGQNLPGRNIAGHNPPGQGEPAHNLVEDRSEHPGRSVSAVVFNVVGAVLILTIGVAAFAVYGSKPAVPTDDSQSAGARAVTSVRTAEVRAWDAPFIISVDGEAATYRVLTVGAEVAGRIRTKPEITRSGSYVTEGTLLLEIDPLNYELAVSSARAQVDQVREELAAVEVEINSTSSLLALATEDVRLQGLQLNRIRSLLERRATSEGEVEIAIREELSARNAQQSQQNQLDTLQQQKKTKATSLALALVDLQRAELDLKRCRILSPISGRIVDDSVEEGDYVKSGDVLVQISDSSRMEVKCSLSADDAAWIWQQNVSTDPGLPVHSELAEAVVETNAVAESPMTAHPNSDTELHVTAKVSGEKHPFAMPEIPCDVVYEFQGARTIWKGVLSRFEGTGMDRETRMFPCRILVANPDQMRVDDSQGGAAVSPPTLLSGMYVTVQIPIRSPQPLLQLPAEAIRPGEQVWVVRDQVLQIVPVQLVKAGVDSALILQRGTAIQSGDRVVVSPLAAVTEGMAVQEVVD